MGRIAFFVGILIYFTTPSFGVILNLTGGDGDKPLNRPTTPEKPCEEPLSIIGELAKMGQTTPKMTTFEESVGLPWEQKSVTPELPKPEAVKPDTKSSDTKTPDTKTEPDTKTTVEAPKPATPTEIGTKTNTVEESAPKPESSKPTTSTADSSNPTPETMDTSSSNSGARGFAKLISTKDGKYRLVLEETHNGLTAEIELGEFVEAASQSGESKVYMSRSPRYAGFKLIVHPNGKSELVHGQSRSLGKNSHPFTFLGIEAPETASHSNPSQSSSNTPPSSADEFLKSDATKNWSLKSSQVPGLVAEVNLNGVNPKVGIVLNGQPWFAAQVREVNNPSFKGKTYRYEEPAEAVMEILVADDGKVVLQITPTLLPLASMRFETKWK